MDDKLKEIREKYIASRFPESSKEYIEEWEKRFKNGLEWQLSDFEGRRILKCLAPDLYPDKLNSFFRRE